jgi:Bacterial PH domain/Short C-terminal domain
VALKEKLLAGEEVVHETTKHWMAPVRDSLFPVLLLIGAVLVGQIKPEGNDGIVGFIASIAGWIQIGLVVAGVAMIVYNLAAWRTAVFAVTNRRVIREEGLLSRRSSATLIDSITDVKLVIPFLGSRLGYGDLSIVSQSGESGADRFKTITEPEGFRDHILGPNVHAAMPAAASVAASAPPPAPEPAVPVDETATLARLAELRDSGVITAEEYEAKKAEILSRI